VRGPDPDPDTLPVHKDVVAALAEWHDYWNSITSHGPIDPAANTLWREINTNPLPDIPEPPLHEQVLAELGEGWTCSTATNSNPDLYYKNSGYSFPCFHKEGRTPTQIADALRTLAGEAPHD